MELVIGENWWELVIIIDCDGILPECDFQKSLNPAKIAKSNMTLYVTVMMSLSELFDVMKFRVMFETWNLARKERTRWFQKCIYQCPFSPKMMPSFFFSLKYQCLAKMSM